MFYVKKNIGNGAEINVPITYSNVYTKCPQCGIEHNADIIGLAESSDGDFDLETSTLFCEKCSAAKIEKSRRSNS